MPAYQPDETVVWSGEMNDENNHAGVFYITNRRLFFERKVGVIRKRDVLATEISLKDMTSTSIEKGPWDWTALVIVAKGRRHRFLFRAESPEVLARRIGELTASQKT